MASIGGAGTFDRIFLTGILAVLIAGLLKNNTKNQTKPSRKTLEKKEMFWHVQKAKGANVEKECPNLIQMVGFFTMLRDIQASIFFLRGHTQRRKHIYKFKKQIRSAKRKC